MLSWDDAIQEMREGKNVKNLRRGTVFRIRENGIHYFSRKDNEWKIAGSNNTIFSPDEVFLSEPKSVGDAAPVSVSIRRLAAIVAPEQKEEVRQLLAEIVCSVSA